MPNSAGRTGWLSYLEAEREVLKRCQRKSKTRRPVYRFWMLGLARRALARWVRWYRPEPPGSSPFDACS
jgi:hypothetical protein